MCPAPPHAPWAFTQIRTCILQPLPSLHTAHLRPAVPVAATRERPGSREYSFSQSEIRSERPDIQPTLAGHAPSWHTRRLGDYNMGRNTASKTTALATTALAFATTAFALAAAALIAATITSPARLAPRRDRIAAVLPS